MKISPSKIKVIYFTVMMTVTNLLSAEMVIPHPNKPVDAELNNIIDPDTKRPAPSYDPYSTGAFESLRPEVGKDSELYDQVDNVEVNVEGLNAATGLLPADGMSQVPVKIKVLNKDGKPLAGKLIAKIKVPGIRIAPRPSASLVDKNLDTLSKRLGQDEVELIDGEGSFNLVAPTSAIEATLSVKVGKQEAKGIIAFAPELRPLIAAGVIEGVINLNRNGSSAITPATGLSDGFERDLRRWQRTFDNGDVSLAGRTTFFLKGQIKGEYLLTAMYDSERNTRARVLRDINPDKFYPVMGDSAQRGYEARSSDRLYVRVDNGKNYVLYGDFQTGSAFSQAMGGNTVAPIQQRNLGQYNRTMTGIRLHRDDGQGYLDSFAMRESMRQAIEEYRGNGTSGPYSVSNVNAIENSEKLEVIVRDRNNLSRIITVTPLVRYVDYTFEPFSGRILLKAALPSFDSDLNPTSLRITYEVDTGGDKYWVYGVSGQRKLNDILEIGGSFVRDENPAQPTGSGFATTPGSGLKELRELKSANIGINTGDNGKLVFEVADTTSATADGDVSGKAIRFDWAQKGSYSNSFDSGLNWDARFFGGVSEKDFNNPASSYTNGKVELGGKAFVEISKKARLLGNFVYNEDKWLDTNRRAESLSMEYKFTPKVILDAGLRHIHQSEGAVLSLSSSASQIALPGQAPVFATGNGLNPAGAGFWGTGTGLNPVTGQPQSFALNGQAILVGNISPAIDAFTVRAGARYMFQENWSVGTEVGQDYGFANDPKWMAINTDFRHENGRVFARLESPTGRATAGGDYKVLDDTTLYGRWEQTNGLASSYALDSAARTQAIVFGTRKSDSRGSENYSEMRMREGLNGRDLESASGLRNTFTINDNLRVNTMGERLRVLNGNGRGAIALGSGVEYSERLWTGTARLEWRQLEKSATSNSDDTIDSWMSTVSVAKKIDQSWTGLLRNYLLVTDNNSISGNQIQNRFQLGAAYRPIWLNNFDALLRYENKFERNSELDDNDRRFVNLISTNANYHPSRPFWINARFAGKSVNETIVGVSDTYKAYLASGRVIYDLTNDFDIGLMGSMLYSPQGNAKQYAYGVEVGYILQQNVWASLGYNFSGFNDRDLTASDYTMEGLYLRLRMKFDEKDVQKTTKIFNSEKE